MNTCSVVPSVKRGALRSQATPRLACRGTPQGPSQPARESEAGALEAPCRHLLTGHTASACSLAARKRRRGCSSSRSLSPCRQAAASKQASEQASKRASKTPPPFPPLLSPEGAAAPPSAVTAWAGTSTMSTAGMAAKTAQSGMSVTGSPAEERRAASERPARLGAHSAMRS